MFKAVRNKPIQKVVFFSTHGKTKQNCCFKNFVLAWISVSNNQLVYNTLTLKLNLYVKWRFKGLHWRINKSRINPSHLSFMFRQLIQSIYSSEPKMSSFPWRRSIITQPCAGVVKSIGPRKNCWKYLCNTLD